MINIAAKTTFLLFLAISLNSVARAQSLFNVPPFCELKEVETCKGAVTLTCKIPSKVPCPDFLRDPTNDQTKAEKEAHNRLKQVIESYKFQMDAQTTITLDRICSKNINNTEHDGGTCVTTPTQKPGDALSSCETKTIKKIKLHVRTVTAEWSCLMAPGATPTPSLSPTPTPSLSPTPTPSPTPTAVSTQKQL